MSLEGIVNDGGSSGQVPEQADYLDDGLRVLARLIARRVVNKPVDGEGEGESGDMVEIDRTWHTLPREALDTDRSGQYHNGQNKPRRRAP